MIAYNIHVYNVGDVQGEAKDVKAIKVAVKAAMIKSGHKYPTAYVKYDGKEAMCTLTAKGQLRFKERTPYVAPAKSVYGEFVEVVSVHGKYCDSMGAYEVLTVRDDKGQEYSVGNMYDTGACFRTMSTVERLQYAAKSV